MWFLACCALCMDDDGTEIVFSVCPGIVGWQLNGNLGEVVGKWESLPLSNYNESMDYSPWFLGSMHSPRSSFLTIPSSVTQHDRVFLGPQIL